MKNQFFSALKFCNFKSALFLIPELISSGWPDQVYSRSELWVNWRYMSEISYYLQNTTVVLMTGPAAVDLKTEGLTEFTSGMLSHPFPTPPLHYEKLYTFVNDKRNVFRFGILQPIWVELHGRLKFLCVKNLMSGSFFRQELTLKYSLVRTLYRFWKWNQRWMFENNQYFKRHFRLTTLLKSMWDTNSFCPTP